MSTQKIYTIDKFLGLNEAADSASELKHGEASRVVNFTVTDSGNLTTRPGFVRSSLLADTQQILTMWSGHLLSHTYLVLVDISSDTDRLTVFRAEDTEFTMVFQQSGLLSLNPNANNVVKVFPFGESIYIIAPDVDLCITANPDITVQEQEPYVPTVVTGAAPTGGGTQLEHINLLTSKRAALFSADGESTTYVLPAEATAILSAETDRGSVEVTFDTATHAAVFAAAPEKGINNLRIVYDTDAKTAAENRHLVTSMPYWEAYNGATDTRLFFYGNGSNITRYTGVTDTGRPSALYVPAMNEVAVDFSASPITGMLRLYNKLMVFKPDGASLITYEPVTLNGGDVIAGFYLRTASRDIGSHAPGQVQLVNNSPRTFHGSALYDWRASSSAYNDERYSKKISQRVAATLSQADASRVRSCDDNSTHTWYMFLGDADGTILVHRYDLDVWTVYQCPLATNVQQALVCANTLLFRSDDAIYLMDLNARYDIDGDTFHPIKAVWESGFMGYGQNYRRKFSTYLWLSVKPESFSDITVTASSDRKSIHAEKRITSELFNYNNINYANWSYIVSSFIRSRRIKLKVKKVTFYKLIIRVDQPGARGTVLGIDQQVRFGSLVK